LVTADCVTLWVGDALGPLERACLKSMLRQGHSVALYCYREPKGVPPGIELRDASDVLPAAAIVRHRSGSVALFSDLFRYELQRRGLGTWIDTDMYLVGHLDMDRPYLCGMQIVTPPRPWRRRQRQSINGSVLRLPADSPMIPPLLAQFDGPGIPDWIPWHSAVWARLRMWMTGRSDLSSLPWGTAGPFAVSALAERYGLSSQALPAEVFNPVPWYDAAWIVDPRVRMEDVVTERTVGIHLWNECIKVLKDKPAPDGSFLARLQREGRD
jgi:hypothetical protein